MANSHVVAGTPRRVRLPISWDVMLAGRCVIPSWGAMGGVSWRRRATHVEFRFGGQNGDQAQNGCIVPVLTREEVTGSSTGVDTGGGAVALMVELTASGITLPESAPSSSQRCDSVVRV